MKPFSPAFLLSFTLALMSLSSASALDAEPTLVPDLKKATMKMIKGKWVINARGEVPTGGYSNAKLVRAAYIKAPEDGIQDVFFLVTPPPMDAFVTQAISPVSADLAMDVPGDEESWIKGVRVHGGDGKRVVIKLDDCGCED